MQDSPTNTTLLGGVARFLKEEILPNTPDRGRAFRVRIAAHLVASVAREIEGEEAHDTAELRRLAVLLDGAAPEEMGEAARREALAQYNDQLADAIRGGDPTVDVESARAHVMETLREKLSVNQPRFDTRLDPETLEA